MNIMLPLSIANIVVFVVAGIYVYKKYGLVSSLGWVAAILWVINYLLK